MSLRKPKPPAESPSAVRAREAQVVQLAELNEEENRKIKQLFSTARGVRAFRGLQPRGGTANVRGSRLFRPASSGSVLDGRTSASVGPAAAAISSWQRASRQ